ncbi:MAG: hypothetical protein Q4G11_06185, partial [Gallicola sp.]|nr:hypothetical protein [Gallicola sp.]
IPAAKGLSLASEAAQQAGEGMFKVGFKEGLENLDNFSATLAKNTNSLKMHADDVFKCIRSNLDSLKSQTGNALQSLGDDLIDVLDGPSMQLAMEGVPNAQVGKFITGGADELAESTMKVASAVDGEAVKLVDEAGSGMKLVDDAADVGFITVLRDAGLDDTKIQEIISIPKGQRPDPKTYLQPEYIQKHLAQFDDGLSIVMTKEQYINYVKGNSHIGIPSDSTQFVMPKNYCDEIAIKANGDISFYEKSLGFDVGHFDDGGGLVRINVDNIEGLNLRMPSGNEAGANSHWIPGGKTDGGVSEAVTDLIPNKPDNVTVGELK